MYINGQNTFRILDFDLEAAIFVSCANTYRKCISTVFREFEPCLSSDPAFAFVKGNYSNSLAMCSNVDVETSIR